mgnify:FL=1
MINLATAIYQAINNAHEYRTFQSIVPKKVYENGQWVSVPFPYVVMKMRPIESTEKDRDDYTLVVSCWDKADSDADTSLARVMGIADSIWQELLHFRYMDEHNWIQTTRPTQGEVPDPDETIKRYDVQTTLHVYRRNQYETSRFQ